MLQASAYQLTLSQLSRHQHQEAPQRGSWPLNCFAPASLVQSHAAEDMKDKRIMIHDASNILQSHFFLQNYSQSKKVVNTQPLKCRHRPSCFLGVLPQAALAEGEEESFPFLLPI